MTSLPSSLRAATTHLSSPPSHAEPISAADKIKLGLQECRLLVLGIHILLGFAYRSFFAEAYESLTQPKKVLLAVSLACLLTSVTLLFAPAMQHRIVYDGFSEPAVYSYTNRMVEAALLPFAAAIGLDLYVLVGHAMSRTAGLGFAVGFTALALVLWFVLEIALRKPESWMRTMEQQRPKAEPTPLKQRIEQLMTETRIILPGVQALLGFQLFAVLSQSFEKLSDTNKLVHVTALGALAVSMILLMAPAAYHRIVTGGEATDDVLRFSHYALLGSMVPLALGLGAGFYVALTRVVETPFWPAVVASVSVVVMLGMWFAVPMIAARRRVSR